ncbi:hypothetical protein [Streptomyces sp. NPDC017993]|uniref:hypothetical protein n=1 Tax=Streptomyces sp. NPDC017993 TaxID=3365027 RepID=UPI0037915CA2
MSTEAGAPDGAAPGETAPDETTSDETTPEQPSGHVESAIVVHGDNHGIISQGDNALNVVFDGRRFVEIHSLLELPLRQAEVLAAPTGIRLFGRDGLVDQVATQLIAGTSVQLYGSEGVGKNAIADAVHHRLAARGQRGHVLRPQGEEPGTLETLYKRLATVLFGKQFLRGVDETELHQAVAHVRDVHITVIDGALGRDDLSRLQQTFPGFTFLFTSPYLTLPDTSAAHHVQPLGRAAAIELLSSELGLELGPVGLQNLQFDWAYRMAEGRPQRLRLYAEFIKGADEWRDRRTREPHDQPPPVDAEQLSPLRQAEALAVALSEPARRVLVALATFGVPLAASWFVPVTGHQDDMYVGPELFDRRLVTYDGGAYRITGDAAAAVRGLDWAPTPAATAAEGLMTALAADEGAVRPDPYLLLAVAQVLNAGRQWALASHFVRTAVATALTAGAPQVALQLYALGKAAALRGGLDKDRAYYVRTEEQTRNLLQGDKAAVAAALLVLAPPVAPAAVTAGGKIASLLGKFTATVTTKTGLTVAAVTVATATAAGVVVAATGDGTPAGCAEAYAANDALRERDPRTPQDLASGYRQMAADLNTAAGEATDPEVKSTLQKQATAFADTAETKEGESPDPDMHPDVTAALVGAEELRTEIRLFLRPVSQVCPME